MKRIGFVQPKRNAITKLLADNECALRFDSGNGLSFNDAIHHTIALGATGSGKTKSVMEPMMYKMLVQNMAALIVDIKGTVGTAVRSMATHAKRENDLVIIGTTSDAMPQNLMDDMDQHEVYRLLETMVMENFKGESHNLDFAAKGIKQGTDCFRLLQLLKQAGANISPSLATMAEMMMNYAQAGRMYRWFKQNVYDPHNPKHEDFVQSVETDQFHLLRDGDERVKKSGTNRDEQLNYAMQYLRVAMFEFLTAPGIKENFASPDAPNFDINALLDNNKIILVRFRPESGPIGERLARSFINRFYKAIYTRGVPDSRPTFVAIDEFQNIADLGPGRYSDTRFAAMAREFQCALLFATQSMSALPGNAEALLANFNNRIMFYNDDPATQVVANRYGDYDLAQLQPQQAFVCRYEQRERRHIVGLETFNSAFEFGREYSSGLQQEPEPAPVPVFPCLCDIVKNLKLDCNTATCSNKDGGAIMNKTSLQATQTYGIATRFPQFFPDGEPDISIPVGWRPYVDRAFTALADSGLMPRITAVSLVKSSRGETLQAAGTGYSEDQDEHDAGIILLNRLLDNISERCPFCGKRSSQVFGRNSSRMTICPDCMETYGLIERESRKSEPPDEDEEDLEPEI